MEKMMGKREKIFALLALVITNILCVVKFLITFVKECNLINFLTTDKEYKIEEINFSSLDYAKVIMIVGICFTIALFLISFSLLFIKNKTIKRNVLVVSITIVLLVTIFYFNSRFICGDLYSKAVLLSEEEYRTLLYNFAYEFHKNAIFMLVSLVLSLISCFVNFSLSNDIFDKDKKEQEVDVEESPQTSEETALSNEINKLKAQIRIKNLESEYLKLKSELDRPTQNGKTKKTQ